MNVVREYAHGWMLTARPLVPRDLLCASATPLSCPANWPAEDPRRCTGDQGNTSFFGAGMVNAGQAGTR